MSVTENPVPLVIVGSAAAAGDTWAVVRAADPDGARWTFAGFLGDTAGAFPSGAPVGHIGGVRALVDLHPDTVFLLAAGTPATRRIVASWAVARGRVAAGVAHPSASFDAATVGTGHVVGPRVRIAPDAAVGEYTTVGSDVLIGAATVGAFVTIGSGTHLADGVVVEDEVLVGRDVVVAPGVRIGARAVVQDGATVDADIAADARVDAAALLPV